jgi:hypothetical protein
MYIFQTTITVPSKVCPGVNIKLHKMTEDRRAAWQLALAEPNAKVRDLLDKIARLKDPDGKPLSDTAVPQIMQLNSELNVVLTSEKNPAILKWAVAGIEGLAIGHEDNPATLENWGQWPSDLVSEVLGLVDEGTVLSEAASKNSALPITPGNQV